MAQEILVPLGRDDRIEEIVPCVEKIIQPGMKVVFLIRYPVGGFGRLGAYWATMETGIPSLLEVQKMVERLSWEQQGQRATQKVSPACGVLRKRGAEVAVEVYTGSLRKVVRGYALKGDVHCVMMRAGIGLRLKRFLHGAITSFGLFKRPSFSPVLLVHPGTLL